MTEIVPVLFRKSDGEITAVFPTLKERHGFVTCYAHLGQHSACSLTWYHTTKPATPAEYGDLLAELNSIYDDVNLVVRKRWSHRGRR